MSGLGALQQQIRVVAAGPGQLGPITRLAAEGQGVLEVGHRLVRFTHRLGQDAQEPVSRQGDEMNRFTPPDLQCFVVFSNRRYMALKGLQKRQASPGHSGKRRCGVRRRDHCFRSLSSQVSIIKPSDDPANQWYNEGGLSMQQAWAKGNPSNYL